MGMVEFACSHCGKAYRVGPGLVGRKVRCKLCKHTFVLAAGEPGPIPAAKMPPPMAFEIIAEDPPLATLAEGQPVPRPGLVKE